VKLIDSMMERIVKGERDLRRRFESGVIGIVKREKE